MTPNDNDQMAQDISTQASFDSEWDATDITHLQPGYLARSKPVRAWERKPASPFTKQRLRVGKVWRRAFPPGRAGPSNATGQTEERTIKRIRAGQSTQSPLKIVKRLCLGPNDGVGLQWDKIGSPTKRIVTRSTATSDLVALSDEEDEGVGSDFDDDEEDVEGTVVEILDEDGRVLQVDVEEAQNNEDWQDEDVQDTPGDTPEERSDDATTTSDEVSEPSAAQEIPGDSGIPSPVESERDGRQTTTEGSCGASEVHTQNTALLEERRPASESIPLPAGFVSPVRRRRPVSRRSSTQAVENNRRRTLPRTFAPMLSDEVVAKSEQMGKDAQAMEEFCEVDERESVVAMEQPLEAETDSHLEAATAEAPTSPSDNDEWEDIAEEPEETLETPEPAQNIGEDTHMEERPLSPTASPSSQHNDLPIRRSPRRKSSSPFKQRSFQAFVDAAPHLVAFSPIKGRAVDDEPSTELLAESPFMLERSVSAPPEEPQMEPRRSAKPRVSDDTALLQAFLNRAAQNKSTRRLSASKRESLSNRRDSDTVRQALASPAKPEILATLDPNSPSPKKAMAVVEDSKLAEIDTVTASSPKSGSGDAEISQERTTRRSHRDKRRVERAVPLAHTRISLRGNTDPVILKRSEAQELATTTRANTRKNKGGSVMPTLRLTKLIVEEAPIETTQEIEEGTSEKPARPGVRNVKWDETLAYYQEAVPEPEVQLFELGDSNTAPKLQSTSSVVEAEPDSDEAVPAPPPAAETPSKPKVRKLRAPRTASTAAKATTSVLSDEVLESAPPGLKQKQSKRSRLATPAKAQDAPSLSPVDIAQAAPSEGTSTTRSKAVPRKKATSRLPAPAPVPASNMENSGLISSPPKKKAVPVTLTTKSAAPKLDFQTKLSAPSKSVNSNSGLPAGLTSPAKRAGKAVIFGKVPAGPVFGSKSEESDERKAVPGLSSPAKKRTRRAM